LSDGHSQRPREEDPHRKVMRSAHRMSSIKQMEPNWNRSECRKYWTTRVCCSTVNFRKAHDYLMPFYYWILIIAFFSNEPFILPWESAKKCPQLTTIVFNEKHFQNQWRCTTVMNQQQRPCNMSNIQVIREARDQKRKINGVYPIRTQPQLKTLTKDNATRFAMGPISWVKVVVTAIGVVAVVFVKVLSLLQVLTVGGRQLISRLSGLLCAWHQCHHSHQQKHLRESDLNSFQFNEMLFLSMK
jgi:hypothetical protein